MPTDKEYLTFCNASNLEWQYVKLEELKKKDNTTRYPYLSELLDPTKFIRVYKDENGVITGTKQIYDNSADDMKKIAGVTMNYLQECGKNSKEGDFLKEWEAGRAINN